jgi:hypothetical protein
MKLKVFTLNNAEILRRIIFQIYLILLPKSAVGFKPGNVVGTVAAMPGPLIPNYYIWP